MGSPTTFWVFWRHPGPMHLHAADYGGRSCCTWAQAVRLMREKVLAGLVVEIYEGK
jgi:hypothetical protein